MIWRHWQKLEGSQHLEDGKRSVWILHLYKLFVYGSSDRNAPLGWVGSNGVSNSACKLFQQLWPTPWTTHVHGWLEAVHLRQKFSEFSYCPSRGDTEFGWVQSSYQKINNRIHSSYIMFRTESKITRHVKKK